MTLSVASVRAEDGRLQALWEDGERALCRGRRVDGDGVPRNVLVVRLTVERPTRSSIDRLGHEFGLKEHLESAGVVRPLDLVRDGDRPMLVLEDPGGQPLAALLGKPLPIEGFLRMGIAIAGALGKLHQCGIVHKDLKPAHILVNGTSGSAWLTGLGLASRLPRERLAPAPPEFIAGTLAYMAPEQTGRMNRSIDSRSDLYALGVVYYQMLTGVLPFIASDAMEWVHCHIARAPVPPAERLAAVPTTVSNIVMRLLAKTAEDRYQTAAGVENDLRQCLAEWESHGRIAHFALGTNDRPSQLLIPEKLYGRSREVGVLLDAFESVLTFGLPKLVLVSGYSGIGKSSVVNELHKVLVPPRGLFAAGKFDQYKRGIPYSPLAQAFQTLIRSLLAKSDAELGPWRDALREALGPNGQLMVELVPELKLIIGEQSSVPELPPQEAQRRFQLVFRRFMSVFATPEHPLALFLDDLQWLDAATLQLLEDLSTHPEVRHVLLIGAYRENEVTPIHPLRRVLDAIGSAGTPVQEIVLAPLAQEHVSQLIADSLHSGRERATSLVRLVHQKTAGNPFFVIQFLGAMEDEGLLTFDYRTGRWQWNLERIHAKGYTDNVIDLMVAKLNRLSTRAKEVLQQIACLGNSAEFALLAMVRGKSTDEVELEIDEALRGGLVLSSEGSYRFLHDRVQEAAYSLIPEEARARTHLQIGRLLAQHTPPEKREEAIFEIVNQLNQGAALLTSRDEREQLAEFNLIAGKRAKSSTAYISALNYLGAGAALLADEGWKRLPKLMIALELNRAECEFLTGELTAAEARLTMLSSRAEGPIDQATVAGLRIDLYATLARSDRAVEVCLTYLRQLGIEESPHPTEHEARQQYERIWSLLGRRKIEQLIDLPLAITPESVAILDVLAKALSPAMFTDPNLLASLICRMVNLSLEHGNTDASAYAYVRLGAIAGHQFGNYAAGIRFGQLGHDLVERRGLKRFQARTYHAFGAFVLSWTRHLRAARDLINRSFDVANEIGDRNCAGYCCANLTGNLLVAGDSLVDVQRQIEDGLAFVQRARFGILADRMATHLGFVRTLRGLTPAFDRLNDAQFDELHFRRRLESGQVAPIAACWYWIRTLQARFFAGDHAGAVAASSNAQRLLWTCPSHLEAADAHFFGGLARAALCEAASRDQYALQFEALTVHHKQLLEWADFCPENFENRALLVSAEIARIEGRELDAEHLYEAAIRSARENGFVQTEALANELAARFYAARGFEAISQTYLRNARYGYLRWGADGKVRQLDQLYPQLNIEQANSAPASTIGTLVEQLDLATVIKVSQAVSGEIVLGNLLDTVMRTAVEHAGAERAVLILSSIAGQRISAEATTGNDAVVVRLCDEPMSGARLPETIVRYVLHAQESVMLDDAAILNPYSSDPYLFQRHARSVLCLPLANQAKLIGVLYLENNLTPRVFAPARTAVLKLLASQAAISLENSRLYRDLAEREARIRRLVDANIIGIVISDVEGRILEANDAFLRMVGYDRDDLVSQRVRWTDMTPPEWRERDQRELVPELTRTGSLQPFEKEFFRKDGSRVPVLIGVANFEGAGDEGVAFVLDLSERKHAQEALNRASAELAHVSRVTALSALTASIAHEVNQPLSGIVTNAGTCLRMLDAVPPNIEGARETARRTIRDGNRASEVIARLRALFSKTEVLPGALDLNEVAREVIALSSNDLQQNRIVLKTELAGELPVVTGDRIQLQQVVLNLLRNALDAMVEVQDRQRELLIKTDCEDSGRVRLSVRDAGVGLSTDSLDSAFQPFFTTKRGGMGIGLFVSRSIIERHQGRLWAEPNRDAPGTTFLLSIPTADK